MLGVDLPQGGYAWASVNEWRLFSGGRNVALDRPATADSQQNGTYAAKANDGDFNTTWFTGKPTLGNWWKVDLGKPHDLTGCRLMWHDPGFCYQYKIEVSADDANWTTVVDKTRNKETKWVPVHAFDGQGRAIPAGDGDRAWKTAAGWAFAKWKFSTRCRCRRRQGRKGQSINAGQKGSHAKAPRRKVVEIAGRDNPADLRELSSRRTNLRETTLRLCVRH